MMGALLFSIDRVIGDGCCGASHTSTVLRTTGVVGQSIRKKKNLHAHAIMYFFFLCILFLALLVVLDIVHAHNCRYNRYRFEDNILKQ